MKIVVSGYKHWKQLRDDLPKILRLLLDAGLEPVPSDHVNIVLASKTLEARIEVKHDGIEHYTVTVEVAPTSREHREDAVKLAEEIEEILCEN